MRSSTSAADSRTTSFSPVISVITVSGAFSMNLIQVRVHDQRSIVQARQVDHRVSLVRPHLHHVLGASGLELPIGHPGIPSNSVKLCRKSYWTVLDD